MSIICSSQKGIDDGLHSVGQKLKLRSDTSSTTKKATPEEQQEIKLRLNGKFHDALE